MRSSGPTILNVAYPLAPVGPDAVGGAEQVLTQLDAAIVRAGGNSLVLASEGSVAHGTLIEIPAPHVPLGPEARLTAWGHVRRVIQRLLERGHIDLIHLHGLDFLEYLPPPGPPVLVTLHLPLDWYLSEIFSLTRPRTLLQCVSLSQRERGPASLQDWPIVENGVDPDAFLPRQRKSNFALCLGRICPEKGFHLAIEATELARCPLVLAGRVFGYPAHQQYFDEQIAPRLNERVRFIGPVGWRRKRRLLRAARCLLVPSLAPETSSLVAMEALACNTPVIAFPSGALRDIVEPGHTGFLVDGVHEMAHAIGWLPDLPACACRESAVARFSQGRMLAGYFDLYRRLNPALEPWLAPLSTDARALSS